MGRKKQAKAVKAASSAADTAARRVAREERRSAKKDHRKRDRKIYTADQWAIPAPRHLVAKLDVPTHKSKYQSYFEFAENTEKKEKRLEFKVTNNANPPPGFVFVPIGDPTLTTACKELSRERDAMIFIVSNSKEENSKISEHIYRTGYHFREVIVEEARRVVGDFYIPKAVGTIEPIPESQEEINKQADAAIRDLFPRIPNTDRQMIVEHAFQKGALFHGEPTVGLQTNIPLSRRVQLAVLAHIRHTHTRYDKLLRETSWMNARKAVEPVCLDVLVKWRGDEETGRDQMDEILREVVIITDSEDEDDSTDTDDSSAEEGEVTSAGSSGAASQPAYATQQKQVGTSSSLSTSRHPQILAPSPPMEAQSFGSTLTADSRIRNKRAQRGFKRYQAAWEEAMHRREGPLHHLAPVEHHSQFDRDPMRRPPSGMQSPFSNPTHSVPTRNSMLEGISHTGRQDNSTTNANADFHHFPHDLEPAPTAMRGSSLVNLSAEYGFHNSEPLSNFSSYAEARNRPLQLVRDLPTPQRVQDLLVPSIEPPSSEGMVPLARIPEHRDGVRHQFHPAGMIDVSRSSPNRRDVIFLDDENPQLKRRRMIHESDVSQLMPVPFRNQDARGSILNAEHHARATLSAPWGDKGFRPSQMLLQSPQGLYKESQPRGRIPVYDRPLSGGHAELPDQMRRTDLNSCEVQNERPLTTGRWASGPALESPYKVVYYQPVRLAEPAVGYVREDARFRVQAGNLDQRPTGRTPNLSSGISPYQRAPGSVNADQDFIHRISNPQFQPPLPQTRDGFIILPEGADYRQDQSASRYDSESQPLNSFASQPPLRVRSSGWIAEQQSASTRDEKSQPTFYDIGGLRRPLHNQFGEIQQSAPTINPRNSVRHSPDISDKGLLRRIIVLE